MVIARSLGVAVLLAWLAVSEPRMLVVLAFALPFWIAAEIESRGMRLPSVIPAKPGYAGLALIAIAAGTEGGRPSRPAPKAA